MKVLFEKPFKLHVDNHEACLNGLDQAKQTRNILCLSAQTGGGGTERTINAASIITQMQDKQITSTNCENCAKDGVIQDIAGKAATGK